MSDRADANSLAPMMKTGFGNPLLAPILQPIAADPVRMQKFVDHWNAASVTSVWDLVTTGFFTRSVAPFTPSLTDDQTLTFRDQDAFFVLRTTISATDENGTEVDPLGILVNVDMSGTAKISDGFAPASHYMNLGTDSLPLPVPIKVAANAELIVTARVDPAMVTGNTVQRLTAVAHVARLAF